MGNARRFMALALRRFGRVPGGGLMLRALRFVADELATRFGGELPPPREVMEQAVTSLSRMLEEIDELSVELPPDAKPIGLAARSLVERSLEACRKRHVDTARLAADMHQVGQLALAMRERLLLAPWERKTDLPN